MAVVLCRHRLMHTDFTKCTTISGIDDQDVRLSQAVFLKFVGVLVITGCRVDVELAFAHAAVRAVHSIWITTQRSNHTGL